MEGAFQPGAEPCAQPFETKDEADKEAWQACDGETRTTATRKKIVTQLSDLLPQDGFPEGHRVVGVATSRAVAHQALRGQAFHELLPGTDAFVMWAPTDPSGLGRLMAVFQAWVGFPAPPRQPHLLAPFDVLPGCTTVTAI